MKTIMLKSSFLFIFALFILTGCKKDESPLQAQIDAQATQDAAYSIASSIAVNNGGVLDQLSDLLNTATTTGVLVSADDNSGNNLIQSVNKQYDSITGWWTITIARERGGILLPYYAKFLRVYQVQFLKQNGSVQKFYLTPNGSGFDTAYSIKHKIVNGNGTVVTPFVNHKLVYLNAGWTATNTNTTTITLNSVTDMPYTRVVSDTVTRNGAVRTLNGRLSLNFTDVKGPRGTGLNWHAKTSGTITGTFDAEVSFLKGTTYNEKTIHRTISITLGGTKTIVDVGGTKFSVDPDTGEITQ